MDALDDILTTLDLRGALYFRTEFNSPWSVAVPEYEKAARFHLVVTGVCHVAFPSGYVLRLGAGDLVMIPSGRSHILSDSGETKAPALETVLEDAGYDGKGVLILGDGDENAATQMICGHYSFRHGADHPFLQALPEFLSITAADRMQRPWLDDCLRMIAGRVLSGSLGSTAAATRLSEALFIEILDTEFGKDGPLAQVMGALRDPQIGTALTAIHGDPAAPWTVDSLARQAGMSRSRFSDRFTSLLGLGPMAYVADWRMQKALSLLDDERLSIQEVAGRSGYRSAAGFTRAFVSKFGLPPKQFRQVLA